MAEQAGLGFGGLLRQLRAEARLTQEELAEAAQVSQRAVSDLERGINRTARKDTAVLLAEALNLAEPARGLFVAAARGRAPAAGVLAALQQQAQVASWAAADGVHGFPAALTSFIGRAEPMREVAGLLSDRRLVTVTGPGGAGKTRLAAQVARQVTGRFADGAWLAELAPVADPDQLAAVVAAALGVRDQPGLPAVEALARALARQQVLLVLDNCEHVIAAAAALCAGLLAACDDVRVLATSREPLRVAGEARYRLASLALPDLDDLAEAARAEAVALFADRARAADARFTLDDQTAPAVARLVTRLDGMPLAIELAAAQVEALGVTGLLDRLDGRLALLASGDRLAPPRQRSLAATVAWSYQLLDETERQVFRAVSVFPAGFTLEGAEAVAGEAAGPAVLRLVDCSLLTPPRDGPDGRPRYSMLETLRAYGLGGWPRAGSWTRPPPRWPGMRWGWPRRPQRGCRPEPGSGRPRAGWTPRTPPCGRCWPGPGATTRRWRCGWQPPWAGGGPVQLFLAWATYFSGDMAGAVEHFTALRDAVAGRPPSPALADALTGRAFVLRDLSQIPQAAEEARRALAAAREAGHPFGEALALLDLALCAEAVGDVGEAVRLARQAVQVPGQIPASVTRTCSMFLAQQLLEADDLAAAELVCADGLAACRDTGDVMTLQSLLVRMAVLNLRAGHAEDAAARLQEAFQLALRTGFWIAAYLDWCAYLCAATGRQAEALTLWAAWAAHVTHQDWPGDARRRQEPLRAARQALGPGRAQAAVERGTAMSLATAAEYALMLTAPGPQQPQTPEPGLGKLSARERELVTLVAQGHTNAQIAAQLSISVRTVGSHLDRIRDKTGCRRRADLTRLALTAGLV